MKNDVLETLKRSAVVPSMPQVVTRFLEIIQDPDFNYNQLVEVLGADPGTTSEVLRLANSALFGVTRQITSLRQALTLRTSPYSLPLAVASSPARSRRRLGG